MRSDRDEGGLQVPRYLLLNGTEPRWRLHDTVDSADLEKSLARVMDNGGRERIAAASSIPRLTWTNAQDQQR